MSEYKMTDTITVVITLGCDTPKFQAIKDDEVILERTPNPEDGITHNLWLFLLELREYFIEGLKRQIVLEYLSELDNVKDLKLQLSSLYGEIKKEGEPDVTDET